MTWQNSGDASRAGDPYATTAQLDPDERYDDPGYDQVVYYEESTGWRWVAAGAAVVLVLAVIGTVIILQSGNDTSTTGRVAPSTPAPIVTPRRSTPPPPVATTTPPAPSPSPSPETVTTLTPSATASTAAPTTTPEAVAATFTYTVSGTRKPGDFVTVTYIDGTGAPRTDFNVTLPWTKTVIPAGAMLLKSVTAVSLASHLDCSITDADGQTIASQDFNTIATTCNR